MLAEGMLLSGRSANPCNSLRLCRTRRPFGLRGTTTRSIESTPSRRRDMVELFGELGRCLAHVITSLFVSPYTILGAEFGVFPACGRIVAPTLISTRASQLRRARSVARRAAGFGKRCSGHDWCEAAARDGLPRIKR